MHHIPALAILLCLVVTSISFSPYWQNYPGGERILTCKPENQLCRIDIEFKGHCATMAEQIDHNKTYHSPKYVLPHEEYVLSNNLQTAARSSGTRWRISENVLTAAASS